MKPLKTAIVLLNLGTPKSCSSKDVGAYLGEFLMDPYVINLPWLWRWLLVKGLIVPFRKYKSAHAYAKVWTQDGSPLLAHLKQLVAKMQAFVGADILVQGVMRYGEPSVDGVLKNLKNHCIERILLFPLYPQYSFAASEASLVFFKQRVQALFPLGDCAVDVLLPFYHDPGFIDLLVKRVPKDVDHLLISFHGVPVRQVKNLTLDHSICSEHKLCCEKICFANYYCYRAQCVHMARLIAARCDLKEHQYSVVFQSRLGREPWLKPYADLHISTLMHKQYQKLAVICPSFVADCLETLEEIGMRMAQEWLDSGEKPLHLVECLNADEDWVEFLVSLSQKKEKFYPLLYKN